MSPKLIKAVRKSLITDCLECILEASTGQVRVNDLTSLKEHYKQKISKIKRGEYDMALFFLQRAQVLSGAAVTPILQNW